MGRIPKATTRGKSKAAVEAGNKATPKTTTRGGKGKAAVEATCGKAKPITRTRGEKGKRKASVEATRGEKGKEKAAVEYDTAWMHKVFSVPQGKTRKEEEQRRIFAEMEEGMKAGKSLIRYFVEPGRPNQLNFFFDNLEKIYGPGRDFEFVVPGI
ncbi:hypothetical protein ACHQM5_025403 [Ranunculus cassubicifolius]